MSVAAPPANKVTNFINGQWAPAQSSEWRDVVNPATGEILASVPLAGAADVNAAVEAAAAAFPEWRRTPPEDRIQPLFKLKMLLEEHIHDIARIGSSPTSSPARSWRRGRPAGTSRVSPAGR